MALEETNLKTTSHNIETEPVAESNVRSQTEDQSKQGAGGQKQIRARRWLKRIVIAGMLLAVAAGLGLGVLMYKMSQWDAQHARFLANGKSINDLLKQYAGHVGDVFKQGDVDLLLQHYSQRYLSPERGRWSLDEGQDIGDVQHFTLQASGSDDYDRDKIRDELTAYLADLQSVDRVKCKINLVEEIELDQSATLTVNYILDGQDHQGRLFQDRFRYRWWLQREPGEGVAGEGSSGDWKIVRDELVQGVRDAGEGNGFQRIDLAAAGIDYVHRRDPKLNVADPNIQLQFAVIQHAAGGVTAVDYNDDGRVDLFFPDGEQSRLYRNIGADDESSTAALSFVDETSRAGLDGLDQAHCGLFADFDHDGDKDLFVTRYLAPSKLYRNLGDGTFEDCSQEFGLDFVEPSVSACLLDYDNDGFLDIYVAVNGNAFEACPNVPFYATNAVPNRLFRNVDGKRFEDVTKQSGTGSVGWTLAVTAGDFNGDQKMDLLLANDFGRKVLYRNNGDGTFTDVAKEANILDFSGGMGVAFGDINDDGVADVYTSNINSNQRWFGEDLTIKQYMSNVVRTKWIWKDLPVYCEVYSLLGDQWPELGKMVGEGNSLFVNNGDGTFRELKDSRTRRAGWSWGVGFFDADNDTDLDLFVANGWISGEKKDDL